MDGRQHVRLIKTFFGSPARQSADRRPAQDSRRVTARRAILLASAVVLTTNATISAQEPEAPRDSVGPALLCDTPQQLNRFVDLLNQGRAADDAVGVVNAEAHDRTACQNVVAAFTIGKPVATATMMGRFVSIVEVTVTAVNDGARWFPVPARTQYTIHSDAGEKL